MLNIEILFFASHLFCIQPGACLLSAVVHSQVKLHLSTLIFREMQNHCTVTAHHKEAVV